MGPREHFACELTPVIYEVGNEWLGSEALEHIACVHVLPITNWLTYLDIYLTSLSPALSIK